MLLLVLALAGLAWLKQTDDKYFIFLVDQSTSISDNGTEKLNQVLASAKESVGKSRVAFLPFAASTREVQESFGDEGEKSTSSADVKSEQQVHIESAEELTAQKEERPSDLSSVARFDGRLQR